MRLPSAPSTAPSSLCLLLALPLLAPSVLAADDLAIKVTKPVSCSRKTHSGDNIEVHYRGSLQSDGTVFDESYKRGKPIQFELGAGMVIKGWDQGLLDMCIGEARKLTIPPELAYGRSGNGPIPPSSTLIFETELMGIEGVKPPSHQDDPPPPPPHSEDEQHGGKDGPKEPSSEGSGECRLLGPFALLIQGALGALALLSLVWKRYRERPRRPIKVWSFDVSKQVVGSMMLHLANLFMSMLSSGSLSVATAADERLEHHKPHFAQDKDMPNPCSFYLLNLAIDTTIGIPILVGLLRVLHVLFLKTPIANPPESIKSGHYGQPPRATWWLKQCIIYFLGLFGMKLCVFIIFQLLPWLGWVGDWALRWTEGNEAVQIAFVMLIFPLVMNGLQYYIIDSFIKDTAGGEGHTALRSGSTSEEDEERRHLRSVDDDDDSDDDDDYGLSRDHLVPTAKRPSSIDTHEALKEANPTPVPQYDPSIEASSSSSPRSTRSSALERKELGNK